MPGHATVDLSGSGRALGLALIVAVNRCNS